MLRIFALMFVLAAGSAAAAEPRELVTAPDAVLCLRAQSLDAAGDSAVKSQERLRGLGCLRSPAGVPATLLSGAEGVGVWSVRFRPEGISGGITLWGRPSAFTLPDGTPLKSLRAEK
jgi:hypothetical protein